MFESRNTLDGGGTIHSPRRREYPHDRSFRSSETVIVAVSLAFSRYVTAHPKTSAKNRETSVFIRTVLLDTTCRCFALTLAGYHASLLTVSFSEKAHLSPATIVRRQPESLRRRCTIKPP